MSARNLERTDIPGRIQAVWRPAVRWMLCLVLVLTTLTPAFGDETRDEILRAAQNPLLSTTPRDQALVLKHINEIHLLRGMGRLTDPQYQNLMFWHQSQNLLIARQAIERLGVYKLDVQKVASDAGAWRTGSDTDFLVSRTDGKPVTLEDIQAIERAYRIATNEQIRRLGRGEIKPPSQRYDTSTDFMVAMMQPHPRNSRVSALTSRTSRPIPTSVSRPRASKPRCVPQGPRSISWMAATM